MRRIRFSHSRPVLPTWFPVLIFLFVQMAVAPIPGIASNAWLTDDSGRALILHGANIASDAKSAPDHISWQTFDDYARMRDDWGFDAIRYLIFWAAVEPSPGVFDEDYLNKVEERLDWADSLGLMVIIDMHQDIYGYKYGGDGAPDWACFDDGRYFGGGLDPWWLNNLWPAVRRAFANLWTDDEVTDYFREAWVHVAERFAGHPAVVGFEIINEPFCGDVAPWTFEGVILPGFYRKVIDDIRSVAPDKTIFYEPHITSTPGMRSMLPPLDRSDVALAPHCYFPLWEDGSVPYPGLGLQVELFMTRRDADACRAGVPWIVGEFGVAASLKGMGAYLNDICDGLDKRLAGWTYWSYDITSQDGWGLVDENGEETVHLEYLVRPYAMKIAGTPLRMHFDKQSGIFDFDFIPDYHIDAPTEIYTGGARIYPGGFTVESSAPEECWSWDFGEAPGVILIRVEPNMPVNEIEITITPAERG